MLQPVEDTSIVVPARSYMELMRVLDRHRRPGRHHAGARQEPGHLPRRRRPSSSAGSSTASSPTTSRCCRPRTPRAPWSTATTCSRPSASRRSSPAPRPTWSSCASATRTSAGITIAAAADVGDAEGEVEASLEGDAVTIAFNARYLVEALQNVDGDQLALELSGPLSPGVLKPVDDADVRPRDHARPHPVLTGSGRAARRPREACVDARPPSLADGLPELRAAWRSTSRRAPGRRRPQRGGQDQPARGARGALAGSLPPDAARTRSWSRWGSRLARRGPLAVGRAGSAATGSRSCWSRPGAVPGRPQAGARQRGAAADHGAARHPAQRRLRARGHAARGGSPSLRRGVLDALVAQREPEAAAVIATYARALTQRNNLLRRHPRGGGRPRRAALLGHGRDRGGRRASSLARARPSRRSRSRWPPPTARSRPARRRSRCATSPTPSRSPGEDAAATRCAGGSRETADKELWNGATLVGPHRDDLAFELDGRDLAGFASRGQQRTAILALKLAELDLLTALDGRPPLLLLDDVFSELDPERRGAPGAPHRRACRRRS